MKITKQELQKIIKEELQNEAELAEIFGLFGRKKRAAADAALAAARNFQPSAAKTPAPLSPQTDIPPQQAAISQTEKPAAEPIKFTPPVDDVTGQPVQKSVAQVQQDPASNPKLIKRLQLFRQNMPQYFQAIQNKIADVIKTTVSANLQQIKEETLEEAIDPSSAISSLITKELNNVLAMALKSVTPEEFMKAYQMVARKNIKDPKQLSQTLKSFRGLEEQETVDVNPLAASEMDLFDAVLQAKKIGISSLVKQAAEKALANPQVQRFIPPEKASKVVSALASSARTVRQLLSLNPQSTAQTIQKSVQTTTPTKQTTAAIPTKTKQVSKKKIQPVQENKQINHWKKLAGLIKG
jgi:hypothetical protein